jgi:type I restriction enzyme S subunit
MAREWRTATVRQLVDDAILERPLDGNHGEMHPKASDFVQSGIPFIMASDLVGGRVDTTHCAFITEQHARSLRKGFALQGDVLISHKATMGRTAYIDKIESPFLMLTPQVTYYRVKDDGRLSARYLKLYFDSREFQLLFDTWGHKGSTRSYLGITSQLDLPIVLPPLPEQRAIAHILGTLDDKIELNRRMNDTLEAIARALFKSWFVDFDPVRAKAEGRDPGLPQPLADLFPARLVDSELGEIPEGWEVGSILAHARLISGGTPKTDRTEYWNGPIAWASAKDVSQSDGAFLIGTERTITERGLEESATQVVPALCSVVVARGATTGRMVLLGRDMAMNQTCYALATMTETPFALYCRLREEIDALVHAAHGSVFDTITTSTFASSSVVLPARPVLSAYEEQIAPQFERVLRSVEESRTLLALRDALLPKLISGELRVHHAERFVERATA